MSSRNVRNSDEHWTWRGRQGDFNSWECVFVSRWQIYTSAPAAFHLFNSLGGGYAAACQSTQCPACNLPECPSSKTHISAPLYERSHSSNSIHSICTKALHQVGSPTTMAEGTVFCCFLKSVFFLQGLTSCSVVAGLLCNRLLAQRQGQKFTTSGSIILMSRGGLLLCSCCFALIGVGPGEKIFGQRVTARSVDCLKLSPLDIGQPSCLSCRTLIELGSVLIVLTCRDTADSVWH